VTTGKQAQMLAQSAGPKRAEFERQALVHVDALYGAAYRLTRNPRDAEDLVQDSLLRAYRFWDSFEQDSNCKAWLLRIVTNTFINEYQRKKRTREVLDAATAEQDATDGILVHADAGARQSPERMLLDRSVSDDVQRALEALPDDFRTAVVLCDVQGLSYKEIAEIMQTPVGTVMSRLFRGRKLLAAALRDFAVAEGYVRDQAPTAASAGSAGARSTPEGSAQSIDKPIDLESYRREKTSKNEGSR
jgi:RNA polymerase sigma-70 factor (ECF subfamily)